MYAAYFFIGFINLKIESRTTAHASANRELCEIYLKTGQYPAEYMFSDYGNWKYILAPDGSFIIEDSVSVFWKTFKIKSNPKGIYIKTESKDWQLSVYSADGRCS